VSGGEVVVDSDGREGGHAIYVTKKRTRSVPPCVKRYGPKRKRGRDVGLERWWAVAVEEEGKEAGPEKRKGPKEEGRVLL
jgi:hypothetical protein